MALDLTSAKFIGPALPEPFVKFDLEKLLSQNNLLPKTKGEEGRSLQELWDTYRRNLRNLGSTGGAIRVINHVIDPLTVPLGYALSEDGRKVATREGDEEGGVILITADTKSKLRIWTVPTGTDLESPAKRGYAYRFSHVRIAQRVLLASQERLGIITDGLELRILISDAARPDSQIVITIDPDWKRSREVPDTFRFLLAIASPRGIDLLPAIIDKARLKQSTITKELRIQARKAIEGFIQEILDTPQNNEILNTHSDKTELAKELWHEGLVIIYRLLFILKGEASDDPARSFGFTGSSIWRNTYSPTVKLAEFVRKSIDEGADTGRFLEISLRTIFKMFEKGVKSTELNIAPLGGALFGEDSTPLLSRLHWPERGCAKLIDKLLWTLAERRGGGQSRQRIHYGSLDIEDLGRVYEALLELEPGIAPDTMCRLRRSKLEVVVPYDQGEKYKKAVSIETELDEDDQNEDSEKEEENRSTKVQWIEEIRPAQFYLRVGLGRKSTGSYYTPHSFVRFLVQETLGPKIDECSPKDNPYPNKILQLKVLDPAIGSGHFLVEACRFMADKLYEACRLCDEKGFEFENMAEKENDLDKKNEYIELAKEWRNRIIEIPDPQDEIVNYLPSTAPEGVASGLSQSKAMALCKRLIAVHCLYGVDKNPLAVELAKLSLWLETQSEGLPLTFLDHRFVIGDSITGPFFEHLLKYPGSQEPLDDMFSRGLREKLIEKLKEALIEVAELEKSIGIDLTEITNKQKAKENLEGSLLPFKILATTWAGGVMLGPDGCDDFAYAQFAKTIAETGTLPANIESSKLLNMISKGLGIDEEAIEFHEILANRNESRIIPAIPYDLIFPEVFFPTDKVCIDKKGFDVVLGNPPWQGIDTSNKEFFANFDFSIMDLKTDQKIHDLINNLMREPHIKELRNAYDFEVSALKNSTSILYNFVNMGGSKASAATPDIYQCFTERSAQLLNREGLCGIVLPAAFHANEGATGIRRLLLWNKNLRICYSFENKRKLFDIHSSYKFSVVIFRNTGPTEEFSCSFYLHDDTLLFIKDQNKRDLKYTPDFIKNADPEFISFPELKSYEDVDVFMICYKNKKTTFGLFCENNNIFLTEELHTSKDKWRNVPVEAILRSPKEDPRLPKYWDVCIREGYIPLHEGKTFHQFEDLWEGRPDFLSEIAKLAGAAKSKFNRLLASRFYRAVFRKVASSTNERTAIFTIIPPGFLCNGSAASESEPHNRPNSTAIITVSLANTFIFDWLIRQKVASNVSFNFLNPTPIIVLDNIISKFLCHSGARLVSNHDGFSQLFIEQLASSWHESGKDKFVWPVLASSVEKWNVRSAIDAVVADAYGLNSEQYKHILRSFDRASGPNPYTGICLAKYDELKQIGLEAFTKKYDPYWDIPLNEELPKPVIELPIPGESKEVDLFGEKMSSPAKKGKRK